MKELKQYYRRRLPHYQPKDSILFTTFRLVNSLPKEVIAQLYKEREDNEMRISKEQDHNKRIQLRLEEQKRYFGHFDSYLDRIATDVCWLDVPDVAKIVYQAIFYYDPTEYTVVAFCIMPNHVHLVADTQKANVPLQSILQRVKSFSVVKSNQILHRSGSFWRRENYDHVVRNGEELKRIICYIIENPVKAELCKKWDEWKWTYFNPMYL
ncbi:MAG: transposase [Ignavibacteriales bacterium]|nr:transposase [Ignavibacteriales bacterium]